MSTVQQCVLCVSMYNNSYCDHCSASVCLLCSSVYCVCPCIIIVSVIIAVWCDNRTEALADELVQKTPSKDKDHMRVRIIIMHG